LEAEINNFNSFTQRLCLSKGREMVKVCEFKSHPKTTFVSSIRPSALYFLVDMISFLGIGSEGFIGRAIEWIAK